MEPNINPASPVIEKRTVAYPRRQVNAAYRTREYLTSTEVMRLCEAAKANRWGHRDSTMILVAYRHGLRACEVTDLRWEQIDFASANMHVRRAKKGAPCTHTIQDDELRALRRLHRARPSIAIRVHLRARRAVHLGRLCAPGRAPG